MQLCLLLSEFRIHGLKPWRWQRQEPSSDGQEEREGFGGGESDCITTPRVSVQGP